MAVDPMKTLGQDTPRVDAYERVTGRATYNRDIKLPGMLYARVLRSTVPHAMVRSIDTSKAEALPGVRAVMTHETHKIPYGSGSISGGRQYSDPHKDITTRLRYTFNEHVRYVGEPVAAVAAINRHVAEEALQLIEIEYDELPFVMDVEEAIAPGAPEIWEGGNIAHDSENRQQPIGGRTGDLQAGLSEADRVFENRFTTAFIQDAQMEPRSSLAHWEGDKLILHTPTQGVSNCRHDTARDLGLEDHQVQVVCKYMGGGFGQGRLARHARPRAHGAGLPSRCEKRRHGHGDRGERQERYGALLATLRQRLRHGRLCLREHVESNLAGAHESHGVG
jgi:xanthine dehydrogenase molybdenum-binding subunit